MILKRFKIENNRHFLNIYAHDNGMLLCNSGRGSSPVPFLPDFFINGSHHRYLNVAYIVQNLHSTTEKNTARLNSHYIAVFLKNSETLRKSLAKQVYLVD